MNKALQLTLAFVLFSSVTFAQTVPQGMKYQAVARNLTGNIIANEEIALKISLVSGGKSSTAYYTEVHTVTTNQLGLFSLVIGEGKVEKGSFTAVPWSTDDIWMQVNIKDKTTALYTTISNSKLLAVPYAFHAGTASQLVGTTTGAVAISGTASRESTTTSGTAAPAGTWLTAGNLKANPLSDFIGNYDAVDLLIKTSNLERIRILANGDVKINAVGGTTDIKGATNLQNTLTVAGATALNNKVDITGITSLKNNTQSTATNNGALVITGGAGIGGNLNVGGTTNFGGASNFGGKMNITDATQSTSTITGALTVAGGTGVAKNLNVGGTATVLEATTLRSTLSVDGATTLGNTLGVTGAATLSSTLDVSGKARFRDSVTFDKSVATSGAMTSSSLAITGNGTTYLATIENKNDGEGDGLKIKLGRAKSSYTIPASPDLGVTSQFEDLLNCNIPETQKVVTLANIVKDDLIETGKTMAGIAVSAGNMIINVINDGLNLPLSIPDITVPDIHLSNAIDVSGPINSNLGLPIYLGPYSTPAVVMPAVKIPALSVDLGTLGDFDIIGETQIFPSTTLLPATTILPKTQIVPALPAFSIPALDIPKTTLLTGRTVMPKLPKIDLTSIGIPEIDISSLAFWGLDISICLDETSSSPLNNSNEFIRFADKNDAQVGSIRGVSVANWSTNYLNPVFFSRLRGAFLSSKADKFHAQYHFKLELSDALASYAKIGVEYSSGNGDYAEWLERSDKKEVISAGDIVSVKGGKITKDLKSAEQVMVVSHAPIMLGNIPEAAKTDLGNSIVFIGQAPVKIMGPVKSGDYIIGQINTPGYGIAKHPNDMTIEDFKLAVGRSWDTDESDGVKLANTVIGVHNSSFLNLIKDLKEKAETNDARLKAIEAKLGIAIPVKKELTAAKTKK